MLHKIETQLNFKQYRRQSNILSSLKAVNRETVHPGLVGPYVPIIFHISAACGLSRSIAAIKSHTGSRLDGVEKT